MTVGSRTDDVSELSHKQHCPFRMNRRKRAVGNNDPAIDCKNIPDFGAGKCHENAAVRNDCSHGGGFWLLF